jgi:hypothetical protein
MRYTIAVACAAVALATPLVGQETGDAITRRAAFEKLQTELARVTVESRITRGAPYSGEAVTETTQLLSDGNRIARKSVTRIYRDSDGRTRRENVSASGEVTTINISDPVGESTYVLYPQTKIAHRNGVIMMGPGGRGSAAGMVEPGSPAVVMPRRTPDGSPSVYVGDPNSEAVKKAEAEARAAAAAGGGGGEGTASSGAVARGGAGARGGGRGGSVAVAPEPVPTASGALTRVPGRAPKTEDLGQQMIEGVLATGTRSTTTIPAGLIGNVKPILIVSEQWFSEELKVLVMTKHTDPRNGETTYRLTNIIQGEPHRSLFEVPADYTLQDSVMRRRTPMQP